MGLFKKLKRFYRRAEQLEARKKAEEPVIKGVVEAIKRRDFFSARNETGETAAIDNPEIEGERNEAEKTSDFFAKRHVKIIKAERIKNLYNETMGKILVKKINEAIYKERLYPLFYYGSHRQSYNKLISPKIIAQEETTIEKVFNEYRKELEKYFTAKEIKQYKLKFKEQSLLANELRLRDPSFSLDKILRLKQLASELGGSRADQFNLDYHAIEYQHKMEIERLKTNKHDSQLRDEQWDKHDKTVSQLEQQKLIEQATEKAKKTELRAVPER